MNTNQREEYIAWKLEENAKESEKLKLEKREKKEDYEKLKEELNGSLNSGDMKEALLTLQEQHKAELNELNRQLREITRENRKLDKEKQKIKDLEDVSLTNHAIVQYLDRARGMNINEIREKTRQKMLDNGAKIDSTTKIQDHNVVDYLVGEGVINLEEIKKEILPDNVKKLIMSNELLGSTGTFATKGGYRLAVSGGKILTFLPKKEKAKKSNSHLVKREKRKPRKMKL